MNNNEIYNKIIEKGEYIYSPSKERYDDFVVIDYAVTGSTFRGFHRKDECKKNKGAVEIFKLFFKKNRNCIIGFLNSLTTLDELNNFEDNLCKNLINGTQEIEGLNSRIKEEMLLPYNKVRKPVDLYIEHIVIMSKNINNIRRNFLKSILFLPLDSEIFSSSYIFTDDELSINNLYRGMHFSKIDTKEKYNNIQKELMLKSVKISQDINKEFNRIYFDLFWNSRYLMNNDKLFKLKNNCT